MKTKTAIPFTMQIPCISTQHMPDAGALDRLKSASVLPVALYSGGAFVFMPHPSVCIGERSWLRPIAVWAASNVFDWVCLDKEGDVVDGLEVYDWEAGDGRSLLDQGLAVLDEAFDTSQTPAVIKPEDNPETGAEPTPRYCVDGNDEHGCYAGDGWLPPFVIFNIEAQENLPGYYQTREAAEWSLSILIERGVLK